MIFERHATREITREEQLRLSDEAVELSTRTAGLPSASSESDVNLALTNQMLTPIAQSGYKGEPKELVEASKGQ